MTSSNWSRSEAAQRSPRGKPRNWRSAPRDFDEFYRSRLREPEDSDQRMVLSFDAKGIATLHRDLREATRKAAENTPRRLETRLAKGEKPIASGWQRWRRYSIDAWPRTIADVLHGVHDKHVEGATPIAADQQAYVGEHRAFASARHPRCLRRGVAS